MAGWAGLNSARVAGIAWWGTERGHGTKPGGRAGETVRNKVESVFRLLRPVWTATYDYACIHAVI